MSANHKHDPEISRANRQYQVLGIHQIIEPDGSTKEVARVRMYVGEDQVDENFPLPKIITVEQQLGEAIQARAKELSASQMLGQNIHEREAGE